MRRMARSRTRSSKRIAKRVWEGMGLIVLHSGHFSKIFKRLMGSPCALHWREAGERERLWVTNPGHPIAKGLPAYFELEMEEMYGEPFSVPEPLETVFVSWFQGGEVFRSGLTYRRGAGNIFYFRPGHETYPTYHDDTVGLVLRNAVNWAYNSNQSSRAARKRRIRRSKRRWKRSKSAAPSCITAVRKASGSPSQFSPIHGVTPAKAGVHPEMVRRHWNLRWAPGLQGRDDIEFVANIADHRVPP
jgi:trehalose utilization protein